MDSKKRTILIAIMLIISIGNYSRIIDQGNIKTVEFLSIFVIGALSSLLFREIVLIIKSK